MTSHPIERIGRRRWLLGLGAAVLGNTGCPPAPRPVTPVRTPSTLADVLATEPVWSRYIGRATAAPRLPAPWFAALLPPCEPKKPCFYLVTTTGGSPTLDDVQALHDAFGSGGDPTILAPDREVLTAAALTQGLFPSFQTQLDGRVGRVQAAGGPAKVTVAMIDTLLSPIGPVPFPGFTVSPLDNAHGYSLVHLTHHLACGDQAACPVQITNFGGLPFVPPSGAPGGTTGGYGSFSTVGQAIYDAVTAWENADPGTERLILNLSLGWHPAHGGKPLDRCKWPATHAYLHSQILNARQEGALVLAAAGNRTGAGGYGSDLLFPAGWSVMKLDDPLTSCESLNGTGEPLLWAVGALTGTDDPLPLSRDHAPPPLVAFGDHAVTPSAGANVPALTGTSVATAVVSAAAAISWASDSEQSAPAVIDNVRTYPETGPAAPVRLCNGVASPAYSCVLPGTSATGPTAWPSATSLPNLPAPVTANVSAEQTLPGCPQPVRQITATGSTPNKTVSWCPEDELVSALTVAPWLGPQPGVDPCPACSLVRRPNSLTLYLDEVSLASGGFSDLSLQLLVKTGTATSTQRFWIDPALLTGTGPWVLQLAGAPPSGQLIGARLAVAQTTASNLTLSVIMPLALFEASD